MRVHMQKNILVVDDNDVNLELIVQLLQQYNEQHDHSFEVLTASNGQEAVDICAAQPMDLIFMDLMMPTMNGAEATKIIKENHPKTMVIVISALGDEKKQKEMLRNGAEDYMTKPVSASLFKSRLNNYIQLIQTRNHISATPKAQNLFTSKVYNYHIDFTIACDADLSEFWEAILMRLEFQRHIDNVSDFVRFIYRVGTLQLQHKFLFHIIVEEDGDNFFFTLDNIRLVGCEQIQSLVEKYYPEAIYVCKDNSLTFMLQKTFDEEKNFASVSAEKEEVTSEKVAISSPDVETKVQVDPTSFESKKDEELMTFEILEPDEIDDFERYLLKLRSLILLMENGSIESSDIEELCHAFKEMASILSISNDTYVLSNALHGLSASITQNQEHFQESSNQLFDFVNAFVNDLIFWKTKIFYDGAPSVDFLNDSITTNSNMLTALLQPESEADASSEDMDDIFDF